MIKTYKKALEYMHEKEDCILAEIIAQEGSSPRKTGSSMLITMEGTQGTIGGGYYEHEVIQCARELLLQKQSALKIFDMTGKEADNPMICGGVIQVNLRYVPWEDGELEKEFLKKIEEQSPKKIYIFGAGHVALETARIMDFLDFQTVVIDDRAEFANAERYPSSQILVLPGFSCLDAVCPQEEDYILIVTRGHRDDKTVLQWALGKKVKYIGMIGSRKKRDALYQALEQEGASREKLREVHSPVGLAIGAETPEEIAISIAAEIIAVEKGASKKDNSSQQGEAAEKQRGLHF